MAVRMRSPKRGLLAIFSLAALGEGRQDADTIYSMSDFSQRTQPQTAASTQAGQEAAVAATARLDLAEAVRDHFLSGSAVCEGTMIQRLLRLDAPDFQTISNIDFDAIQRQADGYLANQQKKIDDLESELQKYAHVMKALEPDDATEVNISKLLNDSMTTGFGGVPEAARSQCGLTRQDAAYDDTVAAWKAAVNKALLGKKVEVDVVQRICVDMLDKCGFPTPSPGDGFCPGLCEALAGMASSLSMTEPEVKVGSETLMLGKVLTTIKQLQKDFEGAQVDLKACEVARGDLVRLGDQVQSIKSQADQQAARQRKASQDLYKLKEQLDKDSITLNEQRKRTEAVTSRLREAKGHETALTEKLGEQAKEETRLEEDTKLAQQNLVQLMVSVKASGDAVRAVQEFKGDLSVTMKSMLQIFKDVVQTPLKDLSADLDRLDLDKWPEARDKKSTQNALEYARALPGKCDVAAKLTSTSGLKFQEEGATFQKVCRSLKQDWQAVTQEIVSIVDQKRGEAMNAVKELREDLHALACSSSVKYEAEVENGEPENLRGILEVFKDSQFYRDYASYWLRGTSAGGQARSGVLLKLFQNLKEVHEKGELRERLEREHYEDLEQQHAKVVAMKAQLGHELTQALQVEKSQGILEAEAKGILDKWTADVEALRNMRATIEPQEERARAAQGRAKEDLRALHAVLEGSIANGLLALGDDGRGSRVGDDDGLRGRVFLHRAGGGIVG